jgi:hypothetical protein
MERCQFCGTEKFSSINEDGFCDLCPDSLKERFKPFIEKWKEHKVFIGLDDMNGEPIKLGDVIKTKGDFIGTVTLGIYECSECETQCECHEVDAGKHYGYHLKDLTYKESLKAYPHGTSSLAGVETWGTIIKSK